MERDGNDKHSLVLQNQTVTPGYGGKGLYIQAKHELDAVKLMISAAIQDNFSMLKSSEKLMDLYTKGLIPKNTQDVDVALTDTPMERRT